MSAALPEAQRLAAIAVECLQKSLHPVKNLLRYFLRGSESSLLTARQLTAGLSGQERKDQSFEFPKQPTAGATGYYIYRALDTEGRSPCNASS